jgi:hypothetical protein
MLNSRFANSFILPAIVPAVGECPGERATADALVNACTGPFRVNEAGLPSTCSRYQYQAPRWERHRV